MPDDFAYVVAEERAAGDGASTKTRIMNCAALIFAERGYGPATIRRIADKASANVAAVNYHFGSKAGLYRAVIDHALAGLREALEREAGRWDAPDARLEDLAPALVSAFLGASLADRRRAVLIRLVSWELIAPQDLHADDAPAPTEEIKRLIGGALPKWLTTDERAIIGNWIVGQCLTFAAPTLALRMDAQEIVAALMRHGLAGVARRG